MIDGPNLYVYLNNNPLNDIDPWGLCGGAGGGFWSRVWDWWERLYSAPFKWWDITSWVFPGTNYCGWTKSGPGTPTGPFDSCCQSHDISLRGSGKSWWQFGDKDVLEHHSNLLNCWYQCEGQ